MRTRWLNPGAVLAVSLGFSLFGGSAMAESAQAPDARDLITRIQRLERDMRDLQAETFRQKGGDHALPGAALAPDVSIPAPPPEPPQAALPDLNPMLRRIDELEGGLERLTGQVEELGHHVDELSQKADRLQKALDFQAAAQAKAAVEMPTAPLDSGAAIASVNPDQNAAPELGAPPATLGKIPANTPLPVPAGAAADPKRQFDEAMNLLSRAQYDKASEAFRGFADAHPGEARASDALYWTGDIAYSTKKDYAEAARDFAELLKKYPKAQRAPEGMLKLGLALFELGQMKEGCAALAALPAKYPDATPIAARAKIAREEKKCR
jgi:tol-pal system protein YbgF